MADRVDGYLSRRAQAAWPTAIVLSTADGWILRRAGAPDLGLGDHFAAANQAIHALLAAERARTA